jgi:Holliday junction resolvasome RuvABC endonuclease subunit
MSIAGIDYSLTCPAICIFTGKTRDKFTFDKCLFFFLTDVQKQAKTFAKNIVGERLSSYTQECERYDSISDWACDKVLGSQQVALEGYAYGAKGRVFHIAENTGILKYKLYQRGTPVEIIEPTRVKKFATGKGNAPKREMYDFFYAETKINLKEMITPDKKDITNPVGDIVDAYYICKCLHDSLLG